MRWQGYNFNTQEGQVSLERVVEGIKDRNLMVALDMTNKHTQSDKLRHKITLHKEENYLPVQ